MLQRARRLSKEFDEYCSEHNYPQFKLNSEEWRQVDYLLCITQPFHRWTTAISKIKDVTIHQIFRIYNKLFDHFDFSISQLKRKRVAWKTTMREALEAGRQKLSDYYSQTENVHGNLFAVGTILAPQHKLQFFSKPEWSDNNYQWRKTYRDYVEKSLEPYQKRQKETQQLQLSLPSTQKDDLELLFDEDSPLESAQSQKKQAGPAFDDELTHYLNSGMFLQSKVSLILNIT